MFFLSIFISVGIGVLVVCSLIRKMPIDNSIVCFKLLLGIGAGFGISSCVFYLYLVLFGYPERIYYFSIEIALLSILLIYIRNGNLVYCYNFIHRSTIPASGTMILSMIKFLFAAALVFDIFSFIIGSTTFPHGQSDAITIYNLRARFIFRDGANWENAFSSSIFWFHHLDYPPLIPFSIVRSWIYNSKETQLAPQLIGFLFTFSTIGLATFALFLLRGNFHGYFGGLVLLGSSSLIEQGVAQQADVPIAFFFLATVVLLYLAQRFPGEGSFFCLAGLMAGFAAWTKNEGILFFVSVLVVLSIKSIYSRNKANGFRELLSFFLGAAPVVILLIYFKESIAMQSDLFWHFGLSSTLGRIIDGQRHIEIMKAFIYQFAHSLFPILIVYGFCIGINTRKDEMKNLLSSIFLLGIMIIGYYFIYLLSPHNLDWHLKSSLTRLFVQLLPCVVFVFFLVIHAPEYEIQ